MLLLLFPSYCLLCFMYFFKPGEAFCCFCLNNLENSLRTIESFLFCSLFRLLFKQSRDDLRAERLLPYDRFGST